MNKRLEIAVPNDLSSNLPVELFKNVIISSPYGYVINDCSKVGNPIIFVNDAFRDITGYQAEEILGKGNRILLRKDPKQQPLEQLCKAIKNGDQCTVVVKNFKKNGDLFYNELTLIDTFKSDDGQSTFRLWCLKDVTESIVAEAKAAIKIAEKDERFSAYMENSNEAIWRLDFAPPISLSTPQEMQVQEVLSNGFFAEANDVAARIYGYTRGKEIIGRFLNEFMTITDPDNARQVRDLVKNKFSISNLISKEKKTDDATIVILNNIRPIIRRNNIHSVWGTSLEISELFIAQEHLRESEEQLAVQKIALREKNIALKELIGQVEEEKRELTERILANVEHVLLPSIERIKLYQGEELFIEQHLIALENLTSSFGQKIHNHMVKLSPREMEVCSLVRNGMVNKEIAKMLNIAVHTVEKHRRVVRKKLGLANKAVNLHSYLNSL